MTIHERAMPTATEQDAAFARARDTIIDANLPIGTARAIRAGLAARGLCAGEKWDKFLAARPADSAPTIETHATGSFLNPVGADEIIATDYPELRFLVPGLIVEGLTLLAGRPKIGKSWLALCLAVAVAYGSPFLGQAVTTVAGVLYLALEDSPRRIKKRLLALGISTRPADLNFLFTLPRLDVGGVEALETRLELHPEVKLVIVDVFNRIRGERARGSDPYQHDASEMAKLQVIAQRRRVSLVIVTHDRKAAAEDWLERITGTLGVAGTADTVALLERDRGSMNGRLRVVGRDLEDEPDLALEFRGGTWHSIGPGETIEMTPERRLIVEVLPAGEGAGYSPTQISRATDLSVHTVKPCLPILVRAGLVKRTAHGEYVKGPRYISHTSHTLEPLNPEKGGAQSVESVESVQSVLSRGSVSGTPAGPRSAAKGVLL